MIVFILLIKLVFLKKMSAPTDLVTSNASILTSVNRLVNYDPGNIQWRGGDATEPLSAHMHIESNATVTAAAYQFLGTTAQTDPSCTTSNREMWIISTSDEDGPAVGQTGALTVYCKLITAAGADAWVLATMNGTTAVSLGSSYLTCEAIIVASVGSTGSNVGHITVGANATPTNDVVCQLYNVATRVVGPLFQIYNRVTNGVFLKKLRFTTERAGPFRLIITVHCTDGTHIHWLKESFVSTANNEIDLSGLPIIPITLDNGKTALYLTVKFRDQGSTGTQQHSLYLDFLYD